MPTIGQRKTKSAGSNPVEFDPADEGLLPAAYYLGITFGATGVSTLTEPLE